MREESLLVVGPGVLGLRAARAWRRSGAGDGAADGTACAKARTGETAARALEEAMDHGGGSRPVFDRAVSEWPADGGGGGAPRYRHVLFCAPPSGNADYAAEVAAAAAATDWSDAGAMFVFTSSAGVYALDCAKHDQ